MKKYSLILSISLFFIACGGNQTDSAEKTADTAKSTTSIMDNPDYQKGLALIGKSDCFTCHKLREASTGPAYNLVAQKYAGAADTTITRLAKKIISGGVGNWGTVPMAPHPAISQADAEQMVKYVLLLKNK